MKHAAIILVTALALAGCSVNRALSPDTYTVRRGDTLSSIAASYGLDWHDLARWNEIRSPYLIEVGQRLSLEPYPDLDYSRIGGDGRVASAPVTTPRVVRAPQDSRAEQEAAIQASTPQLTRTIEHGGSVETTPAARAPAPLPEPDAADVAKESEIIEASRDAPVQPTRTGGPNEDGWQWPASGSVLREYGPERTRQGIDIGGRQGSPVYAASSGRVVYNGTGLKGYGKLVIIQHDEHYLSAYGFTRRTLVKQGQDVAVGTHIADMGLGPQNKPMLHFEVRRDGKPINPASVLPDH
ncbi:peptidoglycan DD-metalloendopeptidase family protein [Salinisphaera aquimarina]|uniref:Peptidoglycan DD-metalloendopeptidase family protein n=1 Tax=Salinisphaera aquimarina TaxID=2094031 RepID=A0ABV7EU72_9GAMM